MPYWVYGHEANTGEPVEPYLSRAESPDEAMAEAREEGMFVTGVEFSRKATVNPPSGMSRRTTGDRYPIASALVVLFRLLAICSIFFSCILIVNSPFRGAGNYWTTILIMMFSMVIMVASFLFIAELLNLLIGIEGNSRQARIPSPPAKPADEADTVLEMSSQTSEASPTGRLTQADCEDEGVVSIWIGDIRDETTLENYLVEGFKADFGFVVDPENGPEIDISQEGKPIRELLEGFSFWESYTDAAVEAAERVGRPKANSVLVFYDMRYKTEFIAFQRRLRMSFLGTFQYQNEEH